jgi:hypothetical protein
VRGATPAILLALIALAVATPARAQTVVTPLLSVNMETTPGFIDLDDAASRTHVGVGVAVSRLTSGWLGVEGVVMLTPGAFSGGDLVESSRLLTATGNLLLTGPARWRVRPYASIGIGLAQIKSDDVAHLFEIDSSRLAATIGAGAWTWFTPRVGLRTSVDLLRTVREVESGEFQTLRLSAGVSIRF